MGVFKVHRVSLDPNESFLKIRKPVEALPVSPMPELEQPPAPLPGSPWKELALNGVEPPVAPVTETKVLSLFPPSVFKPLLTSAE